MIKDDLWVKDGRNWNDPEVMKGALLDTMAEVMGKDPNFATAEDWYYALAHLMRQILSRRQVVTQKVRHDKNQRRVYYLSLEYLLGRHLKKTLLDLDLTESADKALQQVGQKLEALIPYEEDPGLGNGGLGRLAACFMDSLATHNYPAYAYGIRYDYGMFYQNIIEGEQVEHPESWLRNGNPWEIARPTIRYDVGFGGRVIEREGHRHWVDAERVQAMAYDVPISGYRTDTVLTLRLWGARATQDFDFAHFNQGNYIDSVRQKTLTETLSRVLYPMDTSLMGQELRLKQEYFFVSASLQDILYRFVRDKVSFNKMTELVNIHLNDTHPALSIPELLRLLIDEHNYTWDDAWAISQEVFCYTNHTLLVEALETWPIDMLSRLLPRHLEIIFQINDQLMALVKKTFPKKLEYLSQVSLVDDHSGRLRMAHLSIVGSRQVNGVAKIHTQLLKERAFPLFTQLYPNRFLNQTNGVTPRRWILECNPKLAHLITQHTGSLKWLWDLNALEGLKTKINDPEFCDQMGQIKQANKGILSEFIKDQTGIIVNPNTLFDAHIKRIHEYKRQLLSLFHVIDLYLQLKAGALSNIPPRTVMFAGKAAPGYRVAKTIIHLINDVANQVNQDKQTNEHLKVVFVPNYNVSVAEVIIPGVDLSEQISTAGMEASGTSNMKFSLNGALTIGTLDGANVEIQEAVGKENIFIFGLTMEEVEKKRPRHHPRTVYEKSPRLHAIIDAIKIGLFCPQDPARYRDLMEHLLAVDNFMVLADFEAYIAAQRQVEALYQTPQQWIQKTVAVLSSMGEFSSDRTINGYAQDIWHLEPLKPPHIPAPPAPLAAA